MTTPAENQEDIFNWDIEQMWNALVYVTFGNKKHEEKMEKIRNGVKLRYPIHSLIHKWYEQRPKYGTVNIMGYGNAKLKDFAEDKDIREMLMRQILISEWEDGSLTEPRD